MTSFPVINKIFHTKFAPPSDIKSHYNNIQIWMAALVALGAACTQFFKYKNSNVNVVFKRLAIAFVAAILISLAFIIPFKLYRVDYVLLMVFSILLFFQTHNLFFRF
ncbi:MAG: hypothetical protein IPL21_07410 [Saprospirales bacterium]|nr:hypothetical protein [Saprospirales bacterium]